MSPDPLPPFHPTPSEAPSLEPLPGEAPISTLLFRRLALLLWMLLIFGLSGRSQSGSDSSLVMALLGYLPTDPGYAEIHHLVRKVGHFTEYAVLALLVAWNLGDPRDERPSGLPFPATRDLARRLGFVWVMATAYATTDEIHQIFVPNRGPSLVDVGIDAAGAATALLLLGGWALHRRRRRNSRGG